MCWHSSLGSRRAQDSQIQAQDSPRQAQRLGHSNSQQATREPQDDGKVAQNDTRITQDEPRGLRGGSPALATARMFSHPVVFLHRFDDICWVSGLIRVLRKISYRSRGFLRLPRTSRIALKALLGCRLVLAHHHRLAGWLAG